MDMCADALQIFISFLELHCEFENSPQIWLRKPLRSFPPFALNCTIDRRKDAPVQFGSAAKWEFRVFGRRIARYFRKGDSWWVTSSIFSPFSAVGALCEHQSVANNRGKRATFSSRKLKCQLVLLYFEFGHLSGKLFHGSDSL